MPLSSLVFFAFSVGVASAFAGGSELRLSPRHALATNSFFAFAAFLVLLVIPVSVYFYVFHGDWFLHYLVDVRRIPSALAMLGFVVEGAIGVGGFLLGAVLARGQRLAAGGIVIGICVVSAVMLCFLMPERLKVVGTYAQFRGSFGLSDYSGAILRGGLAMACYLVLGTTFLLLRIRLGLRRG
ncbi:MAG: hypothetical protein OXU20_21805 [Myxococcales bacterium]|nr:hypothetical protein [Myxococcales bacterium]MDD9970866.1 hypothetical protein [Myxococcales bacterium]